MRKAHKKWRKTNPSGAKLSDAEQYEKKLKKRAEVRDKFFFSLIVKLRQGSDKDRQGVVIKGP